MRKIEMCVVILGVMSLGGCHETLPQCSDQAAVTLVHQIYEDHLKPEPGPYPDVTARAEQMKERSLSVEDISTQHRATSDEPIASCEATIKVTAYEVYHDPALRPRDKNVDSREDLAQLERYNADTTNLIRGDHKSKSVAVSYTVGRTDDGRANVKLSLR